MLRSILTAFCLLSTMFMTSCMNDDNPLVQDMKSEITDELNKVLSTSMTEYAPPGLIVGVWSDDYGRWITARGLANTEGGITMQPTMRWRVGELTESFTASMILQMVGEGKLKLDTKLNSFYEEFPNSENITIRNLLSHTSGLTDMNTNPAFASLWSLDTIRYYHPDTLLLKYAVGLPQTELGKFKFANTNYFILGRILEMLAQRYVENQIGDRIYQFVSLPNSNFPVNLNIPDPYTYGYILKNGKFEDHSISNISLTWTAGEIISNVYDINHWLRGVMQGVVLADQSSLSAQMLTPIDSGYGFGIYCADRIGSCGKVPGYSTSAFYYKDIKSTVVVMANVSEDSRNIADSIATRLASKLKQLIVKTK